MNDEEPKYQGECYCGAVKVTVIGAPVNVGYCHCHSCRKWHAAPVNAWSEWSKDCVQIVGTTIVSGKSSESRRISCAQCGGCVANGRSESGEIVVYPMTLADSDFQFEPELHLFYSERVLDFGDSLPKFIDKPEKWGGSGEMVDELGVTSWRKSD